MPLPPTRPPELSSLADSAAPPAPTAQKPVAAPPAPSDDEPGFLSRLSDPRVYNTLLGVGAGLLGGKNLADGLSQGVQYAMAANQSAGETDLERAKLAKEQAALTGNAAFVKRIYAQQGKEISDQEALGIASNSGAFSSLVTSQQRAPQLVNTITPDGKTQQQWVTPGEAGGVAVGSPKDEKDDQTLVDVPQPDGTTQKVWLKRGETSGPTVGAPQASTTANEAVKQQQRKQGVIAAGKDPNDPRYADYILSGSLPKENQQQLTASDKQAIREGEDLVLTHQNALTQLRRARELSPKAYEGITAGPRAMLMTNLPAALGGGGEAAMATREFDNLMSTQMLDSLKSIFGGNPTEGERAALKDIQGISSMPAELRQKVIENTIAKVESRLAFEQQRVNDLRGGTYYKPGSGIAGQGSAGGASSPAPAGAKALRFDPRTGGFN